MWRSILSTAAGGRLLGWVFEHMSFALPVHRLRETDTLVAFHHPAPSYPVHILFVPKRSIANLMELGNQDSVFINRLMQDVYACVEFLVAEHSLENPGYRLILNGGGYQDVPQLHFHLVSG